MRSRISRFAFSKLLTVLTPSMEREAVQALRAHERGRIGAEVRLAVALRVLAGRTVLDLMSCFTLARSTVYSILNDGIDAIMHHMPLPGLPLNDEDANRELADGFAESWAGCNTLH